ncbi:TetR/AcrR family transcriptional regulator [Paraburkholderia sediminicola]|uniref:TetR/AcrR family transcriptional regulator n=1 Tax=Paraburkholderia sediminicola TaxID=458836 RepID=UPI0038B8FB5C
MTKIPPPRSKGRPRGFDRDAALNQALGIFWRRGYEPTTIAELCTEMGINPPSLYAAFGNKAQLFIEAARHYENVYWGEAWHRLEKDSDLRRGMKAFFRDAAKILTSQEAPSGCMVVLGAANVSKNAEEIQDALKELRDEAKQHFLHRLKTAVTAGDIPSGTDVKSLAATLNTVLEGMSVQARDGTSQVELERIAHTAMALLPTNTAL